MIYSSITTLIMRHTTQGSFKMCATRDAAITLAQEDQLSEAN